MNICSLVIHAKPDKQGGVRTNLERMSGVEVHGGSEDGKLIVTVEDTADASAADIITAISGVEGIINTALIYHYGGDDLSEEEVTSESH